MTDVAADRPAKHEAPQRSFIFDVVALVVIGLIVAGAYIYLSNVRDEERAANAVEASLLEAALILENEAQADSGTYSDVTAESSELLEDAPASVRELATVEVAETNEDSYCLEAKTERLSAAHIWAEATLASDQLEAQTDNSC